MFEIVWFPDYLPLGDLTEARNALSSTYTVVVRPRMRDVKRPNRVSNKSKTIRNPYISCTGFENSEKSPKMVLRGRDGRFLESFICNERSCDSLFKKSLYPHHLGKNGFQ